MKNHIAFKFIAVLLCTVTLLGAVGSAIGIFVMTEMGLYDKTVEQVRNEQILRNGESFASEAALRYASQTLGGCPEEMVDNHYGQWFHDYYQEGQYSYSILDAEGNEVYSSGETVNAAGVYSFEVSGQYLYMVSKETEAEQEKRLQAKAASYSANFTIGDDARTMDALPMEGRHISYVSLCDADGGLLYEAYDENGVGFLYYNKEGRVTFAGSQYADDPSLMGSTVAGACFQDLDGTVVYEATASGGVGVISINSAGQLVFTAGIDGAVAVAAAEEPVLVPEETTPAEVVPIFYAAFCNSADELVYEDYAETSIGVLSVDTDGRAVYKGFRPGQEPLAENTVITDVWFYGYNKTLIYEASDAEGVGTVSYTDAGQLVFTSAGPAPEFNTVVLPEPEQTQPDETEAAEETEETGNTEETEAAEATEEDREKSSASSIPGVTQPAAATQGPADNTAAASTDPGLINGKPLEEYQVEMDGYYDPDLGESVYVSYVRVPMPEYTVELRLAPGALGMEGEYQLLVLLRSLGSWLFPALGICLLVFAICAVYLCCAAGRKPGSDEVHAAGLNCLPLDLYTVLAFCGIGCAAAIGAEIAWYRLNQNFVFSCTLAVAMAFLAGLILVAFCYAFVAQVKTPGGYWWRNTLCARFIALFMRFGVWLEKFLAKTFLPVAGRLCRAAWNLICKTAVDLFHLWQRFADWAVRVLSRTFRWLYERLNRFISLLPLTWQWLAAGFLIILVLIISIDAFKDGNDILLPFGILFTIAVVLYAAHCFGILSESTKRMGKGDLDTKVDDKMLLGCFKESAADLNALADVAVVAAQKQLKSERMKTELITNVSHDIKTPLTSIINYVDLLQKPHDGEQEAQYLEVLSRQSLRLKKLIDDLMEMSKASTGNMSVEITTVDAVESVNQALGEFSDKLAAAQLTPMFRHADSRVAMMADGKLVWRVLSNILSNAVKYAMPGTRLYIDLMELEGKVVISLKNISREELNVDADELMERFVRGDDSRNTEGSGLGLNIAKSLMELQKGQLQLLVDGDLFKVTLIFPGA